MSGEFQSLNHQITQSPNPLVLHADLDAFFVSVEQLHDPSLQGKPVVVGGALEWKGEGKQRRQVAPRGVVAAASYEARRYGIHSAMPLAKAFQLCPRAIFLPGHHDRYAEASEKVQEIFHQFSPQVEMVSIDEGYLDLTGSERLLGPPLRAAAALHDAVARETGLPCSIGISTSRLVSKVASDQAKPHGLLWIPPGAEAAFLAPLPLRRIPGIGKVSEKRLAEQGLRTVADVVTAGEDLLERVLGRSGAALFHKAQGRDAGAWFEGPVGRQEDPKSVGHETTFRADSANAVFLLSTLSELSQMVGRRLREHGFFARTVNLKLRTFDFHTVTRAQTLAEPTNLDSTLYETARGLFREAWDGRQPVRLVGVEATGLERAAGQLHLLESGRRRKWEQALAAADRIRDRFGFESVQLGGALLPDGRPAAPKRRVHENPAGFRDKTRRRKEE